MAKYLGRHLMVKGRYVDLILSGRKTATIRLGVVKPKYEEMIVHGGGKPVAKIRVKRVVVKRVSELTDEDARLDGFETRDQLLDELRRHYGNLSENDRVTIIEFEVIQRLDHLEPQHPYMGLDPADVARLALRYLKPKLDRSEEEILLDLTRTNSIRSTAIRLYGSLDARWRVRRVLKKALRELVRRGIVGNKAS